MKELEKTKRISISTVLFLLVIVIGLLNFKKPEFVFHKSSVNTLDKIVEQDYILSLNTLRGFDTEAYKLIDLRSPYEFDKGHMKNAINLPSNTVLDKKNTHFFDEMNTIHKTLVLYGEHPNNANSVWMFLYQMGYENIKILSIETVFTNNQFQTKNVQIEKPNVNYAQVIKDARIDKSAVTKVNTPKKVSAPKKVIVVKKKKKKAPEGGC